MMTTCPHCQKYTKLVNWKCQFCKKDIRLPVTSSNLYANIQSGTYDINGVEMHFRSKMEANYALYLDWQKKTTGDPVEWYYEKDTFVFEKIKFGTRSFKVDFTVVRKIGTTEYHECKGYLDPKSKTKLKRMRIYYPDKKIVLIDTDQYKAIMKWKRLFGGY